jgi:MFS family permease
VTDNALARASKQVPHGKASTGAAAPSPEPVWTRDFVLVCVVNVLAMWGFSMLMPTLPLYVKQHMGGQGSEIGLIMGVFALSALAFRPWSGRWMDRVGRRGIYLFSLTAVVPIYLAYSLVPASLPWLLAVRLLHGVVFGIMITGGGTIVADTVPATRRGEGIGYFGMFAVVSSALAPSAGLAVMGRYGFTGVAVVSAAVGLAGLLLARTIRYQPVPKKAEGPTPAKVGGLLTRYVERRSLAPSVVAMCLYCAQTSVMTFLPVHALRQGVGNVGLFFAVNAVTVTIFRAVAGKLYDSRDPSLVIVPGLFIAALSMVLVGVSKNLEMFLLGAVLFGIGIGAVAPSLQAMSVEGVASERRGAANSTYFSALDIGMGGGAILLGAVAQAFSYTMMYFVAAGLTAFGLVLFAALRPARSTMREPAVMAVPVTLGPQLGPKSPSLPLVAVSDDANE